MSTTCRRSLVAAAAFLFAACVPHLARAQFGNLGSTGASNAAAGNSLSAGSLANSITGNTTNRGMDAQSLRGFGGADAFRSAIGADTLGTAAGLNAMNMNRAMMGMGMMGRMGGFGGMGMNQFGMNQQQNQRGRQQLRIPMRLGFTSPPAQMSVRSRQFATRVPKIPGLKNVRELTIEMDGETAILRGKVDSEDQRLLVERMAKLEPGISAVQNELQVEATESLPAPTP
ncbi:MAG: BON domain-containing protein [Pirellulales bacterium]